MPIRLKTLSNLFLIIFILLVPVIFLYGYANWESTRVIKDQVQTSNLNRLQFFRSQIDEKISQITKNVFHLMHDTDVKQFSYLFNDLHFENVETLKRIREKLTLSSSATGWITDLSIYSPLSKRLINATSMSVSNVEITPGSIDAGIQWTHFPEGKSGKYVFVTTLIDSLDQIRLGDKTPLFQIRFHEQDLTKMLDSFKNEGRNDPFLYHPSGQFILSSSAESSRIQTVAASLAQGSLEKKGYKIVELEGEQYFLTYVTSNQLDWFLVDYEPLGTLIKPIMMSRNIFSITASCLGAILLFLSLTLYKQVRLPIKNLVISLSRFKNGDYSSRVVGKQNNEFDFLGYHFNEMAAEIQHLIETVYTEKLHSQTASLKQLQSQINPHFLYNCLHFISIMNYRGDRDAVNAMVLNLGDYYRYTTRLENTMSTVREELQVVYNYLEIHRIRMQRLTYRIEVPESVQEVVIPRLILQPIVENSIIHGIDHKSGPSWIHIDGYMDQNRLCLTIEDNGTGLSEQALDKLQQSLSQSAESHQGGIGVWNVHQRLLIHYGSSAGLELFRSSSGGLKTCLKIMMTSEKE